jgi:hypothetical protein
MREDIAEWQRQGPLFGSYDEPGKPGDRLCVETHNVYHHDRMVQVGPFFVHKNIYESAYYPPKAEDYAPELSTLKRGHVILMVVGLLLVGIALGSLIPV